ncbi:MAG: dihydroorotase [Proteobacteria bacterium]|nr:MAG: dihydroorotase [Pseudomonadota bacterium]PIE18999.1 MAG: dihydroorotase [Pseudomonadota bacterium]
MSLLIRGGRVIDPANGVDRMADVLVEEGRVSRVDSGIPGAQQVIDANDKLVLPGLCDLHARFGEPGLEYKEDLASGSAAAVAGGFTTVCVSPATEPINDRRSVTEHIVNGAAARALCRVLPVGALTVGFEGTTLCELADMKEAGIVAVGDDCRTIADAGLMRRALEYASTFDLCVLAHCEDRALAAGGQMHEGTVSTRCGIPAQPAQAESAIVARDLELVELTGARYHLQHISTAQSVEYMRRAKRRGLPVSCEVSALHLRLHDEACKRYDSRTKLRPPLRSAEHVEALEQGLADGTIDAIVSDHLPQTSLEKELEYGLSAFGASSLETTLPLVLDLWRADLISLDRAVACLSANPAALLGLEAGSLSVGAAADLIVVDPELRWVVEGAALHSRSPYTPLEGEKLRGAVVTTLVGGRVVYERAAD